MQLTLWTYEGPPHIGAMRVATGMKGLHYVLHAPQGDTYADLLFTMIERRNTRPPVMVSDPVSSNVTDHGSLGLRCIRVVFPARSKVTSEERKW